MPREETISLEGRDVKFVDACQTLPPVFRAAVLRAAEKAVTMLPAAKRLRTLTILINELAHVSWQNADLTDSKSLIEKSKEVRGIATARGRVFYDETQRGVYKIYLHADVLIAEHYLLGDPLDKNVRDTIQHELMHILQFIDSENETVRVRATALLRLDGIMKKYESANHEWRMAPEMNTAWLGLRRTLFSLLESVFIEGIATFADSITKIRWDAAYLKHVERRGHYAAQELQRRFGICLAAIKEGTPTPPVDLIACTYDIGFNLVYCLMYANPNLQFKDILAMQVFQFFREAETAALHLGITPPFSIGNTTPDKEGLVYTRGKGIFDYNEALAMWRSAAQQGHWIPAIN